MKTTTTALTLSAFSFIEPKPVEEEESQFSSPLMLWLQQEQKRKESIAEKKPKKGLVFEISSDDGFQICAESIEGEEILSDWPRAGELVQRTCIQEPWVLCLSHLVPQHNWECSLNSVLEVSPITTGFLSCTRSCVEALYI